MSGATGRNVAAVTAATCCSASNVPRSSDLPGPVLARQLLSGKGGPSPIERKVMTTQTRSKLSVVGAAMGAILAGEVLFLLLGSAFPVLFRPHAATTLTSVAVFAKQASAQAAP